MVTLVLHNIRSQHMYSTGVTETKFSCGSLTKVVRHLCREAMRAGFILSGVTNASGPIAVCAVGLYGASG